MTSTGAVHSGQSWAGSARHGRRRHHRRRRAADLSRVRAERG
ncbi:MAG TPA: hypothetical protein VFE14_04085 [Micromonosporaceae bacterium]|nr:hypothetical protein [Micromonosporaceae bacterium]